MEPVDVPALERRYRHWMLCDYNRTQLIRYLDRLVALNDPDAVHAKSVLMERENPAESARLLQRAKDLGWRQRTRQDEMRELATPRP